MEASPSAVSRSLAVTHIYGDGSLFCCQVFTLYGSGKDADALRRILKLLVLTLLQYSVAAECGHTAQSKPNSYRQ